MTLLYRTMLLLASGGGLIVAVIMVFMLAVSWANSAQVRPIGEYFRLAAELRQLRDRLSESAWGEPELRPAAIQQSPALALRRFADEDGWLAPETTQTLSRAAALLEEHAVDGRVPALRLIEIVLSTEGWVLGAQLDALDTLNRREFQAVLALCVVLPISIAAFSMFFHRRVAVPLNDLGGLLELVARKDYKVTATDRVDPLVRPLFEKYNRMVRRMRDLEVGHVKREGSLRQELDQATRAMFQQQVEMARVERLAAVRDVSARFSHELRNPLSGVLMALTNLRAEIDEQEQVQRLGLAICELERMGRQLSRVVDESRLAPERPRSLRIRALIEELAGLVHYQLPDGITLATQVDDDLQFRLPESGLRSALLNLLLNAAQALHERSGSIRVAAERRAEALVISVSDDGPGFPTDMLDAGVHEFGSWLHGGTGLGLATVKRFVLANGGRLELRNRPEGGASASMWLHEAIPE